MAEADIITLEYDDGTELECEMMGVFEADGKEYIALIPQDDSDDVYIYGLKTTRSLKERSLYLTSSCSKRMKKSKGNVSRKGIAGLARRQLYV